MSEIKLSGMNREAYTIPANSIKTINYADIEPNYYHIQNMGNTTIYFSAHSIPTKDFYDMKVDGGSISTFTDPYPQSEVYIFNPNSEDVNVIVSSFKAPFDPVVLASMNHQLTLGGTIETDGIIKGFECALPRGNNNIGKVIIDSGKIEISSPLPEGSKVEVTNLDGAKLSLDFMEQVEAQQRLVTPFMYKGTTYNAPNGYYISKINSIKGTDGKQINLLNKNDEVITSYFGVGEVDNMGLNCGMGLRKVVATDATEFNIVGELMSATKDKTYTYILKGGEAFDITSVFDKYPLATKIYLTSDPVDNNFELWYKNPDNAEEVPFETRQNVNLLTENAGYTSVRNKAAYDFTLTFSITEEV